MTMYELSDPTAESALTADAARSVDVRVLLDADDGGSRYNAPAFSELAGGGVHVAWSNAGEIFHQKTITVDDATSLIMTGNLVTTDEATSHDFAVTDTDAADVGAVVSTFDADFAGGAPGPRPGWQRPAVESRLPVGTGGSDRVGPPHRGHRIGGDERR